MALPSVDPGKVAILAAAYGITLTDAQVEALPLLIEKAQELLPVGTEQWIADGRTKAATVVSVVEDMVVRVARNPRGLRQVSIDDFTGTIDQALSSGGLYLAPDELERLTPTQTGRRRIGTVRVGLDSHRVPRC